MILNCSVKWYRIWTKTYTYPVTLLLLFFFFNWKEKLYKNAHLGVSLESLPQKKKMTETKQQLP